MVRSIIYNNFFLNKNYNFINDNIFNDFINTNILNNENKLSNNLKFFITQENIKNEQIEKNIFKIIIYINKNKNKNLNIIIDNISNDLNLFHDNFDLIIIKIYNLLKNKKLTYVLKKYKDINVNRTDLFLKKISKMKNKEKLLKIYIKLFFGNNDKILNNINSIKNMNLNNKYFYNITHYEMYILILYFFTNSVIEDMSLKTNKSKQIKRLIDIIKLYKEKNYIYIVNKIFRDITYIEESKIKERIKKENINLIENKEISKNIFLYYKNNKTLKIESNMYVKKNNEYLIYDYRYIDLKDNGITPYKIENLSLKTNVEKNKIEDIIEFNKIKNIIYVYDGTCFLLDNKIEVKIKEKLLQNYYNNFYQNNVPKIINYIEESERKTKYEKIYKSNECFNNNK